MVDDVFGCQCMWSALESGCTLNTNASMLDLNSSDVIQLVALSKLD